MRSRQLGQNFLRNKRTARRLVHSAGGEPDLLCVDLGAGTGSVTASAVAIRTGPILAVEYDQRLVSQLASRYRSDPRVAVLAADLLEAPLPNEPFVIAANPPFNTSTKLVRRWMLSPSFVSGALIVETSFARRVSGLYGATKLSLSLAPFLALEIGAVVRPAEFTPAPNVATVILASERRAEPGVSADDSSSYWAFVNYLFERGSRTVGESLDPLFRRGVPRSVASLAVRDLNVTVAIELFAAHIRGDQRCSLRIQAFEDQLPAARRWSNLLPQSSGQSDRLTEPQGRQSRAAPTRRTREAP
ncbi:MAG: hypothetical protein KDB24_12205 [Microthrixaceae bacterium]|nr:hypothetical protein [Microthrixaceae bacterium]